jgi:antitoxin MazE
MGNTIGNISKWGNSLAVRIPQHLAKEIGLVAGVEVEISIDRDRLTISPKRQREYSLEELVAAITPENCHAEINTGEPVGEEAW